MVDDGGMILKRSRNFRLLWTGQVISVIGDGMQRITLLWWAAISHGTAVLVALGLASIIPTVALSPFGGWLADRYDRRLLMVGADVARLITTAALAAALGAGRPSPVLVVALLALTEAFTAVFDPAYAASVPQVVAPGDLPSANGMNMANSAVGGVLGPVVGGALIGVFSPTTVLAINAVTFVWSAAFIVRVTMPQRATAADDSDGDNDAPVSIGAVLRSSGLWRLLGLAALLNMVFAPMPLMIVALAVRRFDTSSLGYSVLEMAIAAGILVGALAAARTGSWSLMWPMVAIGALIAAAGSLDYIPTVAVFAAMGVAAAIANSLATLRFQRTVPAELHGRAFGLSGAICEGLRPVGALLGAPLLAATSVGASFAVVGVGAVVCSLVLIPGLPTMPDDGQPG
jgi:MFS transporter, DHA3 family, macrolide efflux protein